MTIKRTTDDELLELIRKMVTIPRIPSFVVDDQARNLIFSARMDETYQLYQLSLHSLLEDEPKPIQLTKKEDGIVYGYDLSPSGRYLIFPRDQGGSENYRVYWMDLDDSSPNETCLTPSPIGRIALDWFPDEKKVLVTGSDDDTNYVKILNINDGELETLFTADSWIDSDLSKDGKYLAVSVQRGDDVRNLDIITFPVQDPSDQKIISYSEHSQEMNPAWSRDGKYLAFITNEKNNPRLIIWDNLAWEEHCTISLPDEGIAFWPITSTSSSDTVYLIIDHHGKERLYRCDIKDGTLKELFDSTKGSIHDARVVRDKLFVISSSFTEPPRLEFYDARDLRPLCPPYPQTAIQKESFTSLSIKEVWYPSFDGKKIQAWFINSDTEGNRPVIIKIHGGPTASSQNSWNPQVAVLAMLGFSLFLPNYRGSTGFGPEFRMSNIEDLGGGDFQDVIYGVKWLREHGFLKKHDPSIIGGSYGGYMTVYAMVRAPDLWKCGIASVPVTDWVADYDLATADFRFFDIYYFGGTPKEKRELYVERSPITYIKNLKAPLLIIHGKNDTRCPFKPVKEFYDAARCMGKEIFLYSTEDEGHGSMKLSNTINDIYQEASFLLRQHDPH